jgi:diguanylate cyclase (GGDEF)-like protein
MSARPPADRQSVETLAGELDRAIDEHVALMLALYRSIAIKAPPQNEVISESGHLLCGFGSWHEATRKDPLVDQPAFRALMEFHKKLHDHMRWLGARAYKDHRVPPAEIDAINAKLTGFIGQARRLQSAFRHAISDLDPLTGVRNRQAMLNEVGRERERALRTRRPCAIALGDLDHFKKINDTYGHGAGDTVLAAAAQFYVGHLRPYDLLYRYGGEEFLFCLPNVDAEGAAQALDRLRAALETLSIALGEGRSVNVTTSFGVAAIDGGESLERTIEKADTALYEAKADGRNRVQAWRPKA